MKWMKIWNLFLSFSGFPDHPLSFIFYIPVRENECLDRFFVAPKIN